MYIYVYLKKLSFKLVLSFSLKVILTLTEHKIKPKAPSSYRPLGSKASE